MTATPVNGEDTSKPRSRALRSLKALRDRRMLAMFLLSLAAGLPYGAVLGTLNAWLTQDGVKPSTIGVFSLVIVAYAFKFMWAPAFQDARSPFAKFARLGDRLLGARRDWLILLQVVLAGLLAWLALINPASNIALAALIALLAAIASATHDIVLDSWRIEVARSEEDKDLMSAVFQFGYRLAGLATGFVALMMAARIGWSTTYLLIALAMAAASVGTLIAPEPEGRVNRSEDRPSFLPLIPETVRGWSITALTLAWLVAFWMLGQFVFTALTVTPPPSGSAFVREQAPIIVGLCIIAPAILGAFLLQRYGDEPQKLPQGQVAVPIHKRVLNTLFRYVLDPLMDLVARLKWAVILVLALALSYRFTDAVWGSFAYPFYLGLNYGALGHSLDDVAIASKFFGVIMTITGAGLGAVAIGLMGRMPCMVIGAAATAATNLIFADLAISGAGMDSFMAFTGLEAPMIALAEWAGHLSAVEITDPEHGRRLARLMVAIAGENLAGGFASVCITVFLTSVVNPRFAAVQFALLASLSMMIGSLGRPFLGEMIEQQGFHDVFVLTAILGVIAVFLSLIEWGRQALSDSQRPETA